MAESDLHRRLMKAASKAGARLFRNNVAMAWVGERVQGGHGSTVVLKNARVLHAGLGTGSSDLIGFVPVTITPEMVGRKVAIFASVEVKTDTGRASDEQLAWIAAVENMGGVAGIARCERDLHNILCMDGDLAPTS